MSRTQRFYNKIKVLKTMPWVYHPYLWRCMGNCKFCKDKFLGRRKKLEKRREAEKIIKEEHNLLEKD